MAGTHDGFTDIHQHFLYGIDDGPETFRDMARMLDAAVADGVARIVATPHITPGLRRFDREAYYASLRTAMAYCQAKQLPLDIYEGAEIYYTPMACDMLAKGRVPTLAGTPYVLVEFAPRTSYREMERALKRLMDYGYKPVVAHIERYACLTLWGRRAYALKKRGVLLQMNCGMVLANRGSFRERAAWRLLRGGAIDFIATDAHDTDGRRTRMKKAYGILHRELGRAAADRLTGNGERLWFLGQ